MFVVFECTWLFIFLSAHSAECQIWWKSMKFVVVVVVVIFKLIFSLFFITTCS